MLTKSNLWRTAAILLLLLNIGLLVYLYTEPMRRQDRLKHFVIEALQLDKGQVATYDTLIWEHRDRIGALEADIAATREQLFRNIGSAPDSLVVAKLASLYTGVDSAHMQHFAAVRALCRPEQLPNFEKVQTALPQFLSRQHTRKAQKPK